MKSTLGLLVGSTVVVAMAAVAFAKGKEAVLMAAADYKWEEAKAPPGMPPPPPGAKPPMIVPISGDMVKGAHAVMVKFESGVMNPLHTHSSDLKGVVVQGTFVVGPEGGEPKKLGPGSYYMIPGGWKHTSGCQDGPCLLFQDSAGKFDLKPAEAPKK
jgi:quercetin dioxygenase-like cupin family protein